MDKVYKVIVSDRARQMLGAHLLFIAKVSPSAARKTKNEIITALKSLKRMPERYPFFNHITPNKYHCMFVEKWYLVLHQIKDDTVFADYIVDCRQDYQWLIN